LQAIREVRASAFAAGDFPSIKEVGECSGVKKSKLGFLTPQGIERNERMVVPQGRLHRSVQRDDFIL
jgi:hypothetical protein